MLVVINGDVCPDFKGECQKEIALESRYASKLAPRVFAAGRQRNQPQVMALRALAQHLSLSQWSPASDLEATRAPKVSVTNYRKEGPLST